MSDLDAQGNVDNSNIPVYGTKAKSNATDTRRLVGDNFPSVHKPDINVANTPHTFQTIKELTGVDTAVEGVEIISKGSTLGGLRFYRSYNTLVKLGGVTGSVTFPPTADFLSDKFVVERTKLTGSLIQEDPNQETSEGIFIPITDLSQISIAGITNTNTRFLPPDIALYDGFTEIKIK